MENSTIIQKIKRLEIATKGLSKQLFSGEYHSAFKGSGMTFSEVRNYAYGDEVRTIDWNVTARYNEPHIKVFEEERELTVLLLIDLSGSTHFGTKTTSKKNLAIEIAATLAFSAMANNDKVGALIYTNKVELYIPPKKGKQHVFHILNSCLHFNQTNGQTDLNSAIEFLHKTQKKRTITFIISDFIEAELPFNKLHFLHKKHDLVAVRISDPSEEALPNLGFVELLNSETGTRTWVDTSDMKIQKEFKEQSVENQEKWAKSLSRLGIDSIHCSTENDPFPQLVQLFKKRKK